MIDDLSKATTIAAFGMKAQAKRLRVVSENLANADSLGATPGAPPYRRKLLLFRERLDRALDAKVVRADRSIKDNSAFGRFYEPTHPAAGEDGYVQTPNVNPLIEMMDMREAQRSYEANLQVVAMSRDMVSKTIDLLR